MSKILSIRIGADQEKILDQFARSEGKSISHFVRDTIFEKIEEEMDIQLLTERIQSDTRNKELSKDLEQVISDLGL
jgi:predicted DNA-binding protein